MLSVLIILCLFVAKANANSFSSEKMFIMRARNQYLRFYLFQKKENLKTVLLITKEKIQEKTDRVYNYVMSKYYDAHALYYGLPEEDRIIIEQIINLHF